MTRGALTLSGVVLLFGACNGQFRFEDLPIPDATVGGVNGLGNRGGGTAQGGGAGTAGEGNGGKAGLGGEGGRMGCQSDADCGLATLHCDDWSGKCLPCVTDLHCGPSAPRCHPELHRCVECAVSRDCKFGRVCEPTARRCVLKCYHDDGDDGIDKDCPSATPRCRRGPHICVHCLRDVHCQNEPNKVCDLANGHCSECLNDANCPPERPRCDRLSGQCVQCSLSDQCPLDQPLCDPILSQCVSRAERNPG